uniref:Nucleoporin Nup37 n=1 Tax=Sinocyclocheilus grahami TaxID=75366 RepID=A0A672NE80_SINGR
MPDETVRSASYTVSCEDYVHVVEFSPFDCGTCRFKEEDTEIEDVEFTNLQVFSHGVRVDAIAWSPETRLDKLPPVIRFCTTAADRKIRLWTSIFKTIVMEGHTNYINHLVFEPAEGKEIASVSDDHTCRVWDLDGCTFQCELSMGYICLIQLMVAEKKGTIRFYDLVTQHAILSLDSGHVPLMSADWCLTNTIKVGAVVANDWVIWDITRSSYPLEKRPGHVDKARHFRWSRANENLFATTGYPGKINSQLLVHHLGHPQPVIIGSASVGAGLSWHRTLPLCVIGGYRKLFFWMTEL